MLVILNSTNACNLGCRYCSAKTNGSVRRDLSEDDCQLLVAQLPAILKEDEPVTWLWHGGEPTLLSPEQFDAMQTILSTLADHLQRTLMQSNAYAVTKDWINVLLKHDVSVGVSLDGPKETHDAARPAINGSGTYDLARANALALRDAGMAVSLLCTLDKTHIGREEMILDWLIEMDMPIRFNPLSRFGRSSESLSGAEYYRFLIDLFKGVLKKRYSGSIQPLEWMSRSVIFDEEATECAYNGQCGKTFFSIGPGAEITPCGRLKKSFGNLRDSTLDELWQSSGWSSLRERSDRLATGECRSCEIWNFCKGGCPADEDNRLEKAECDAKREFFDWLRTDGLELYRKALIERKKEIRAALELLRAEKDRMLI